LSITHLSCSKENWLAQHSSRNRHYDRVKSGALDPVSLSPRRLFCLFGVCCANDVGSLSCAFLQTTSSELPNKDFGSQTKLQGCLVKKRLHKSTKSNQTTHPNSFITLQLTDLQQQRFPSTLSYWVDAMEISRDWSAHASHSCCRRLDDSSFKWRL